MTTHNFELLDCSDKGQATAFPSGPCFDIAIKTSASNNAGRIVLRECRSTTELRNYVEMLKKELDTIVQHAERISSKK